MSETLLPCPFCGGEALMRERYINGIANKKHYRRECRHCRATFAHWFRSMKKADEAWNRRKVNQIKREREALLEVDLDAIVYAKGLIAKDKEVLGDEA